MKLMEDIVAIRKIKYTQKKKFLRITGILI